MIGDFLVGRLGRRRRLVFTIDMLGGKLGDEIDSTAKTRADTMMTRLLILAMIASSQGGLEPEHEPNVIYRQLVGEGWDLGERKLVLPPPLAVDGQTATAEQARLVALAGSERAAQDLVRDSVTAPFIIKVRDEKTTDATVRIADTWFVVRADLTSLDPEKQARAADQKRVEAANMLFETRMLGEREIESSGAPTRLDKASVWYAHVTGRLLDRIAVEATNEAVATRSPSSIVVASRVSERFTGANATGWKPVTKENASGAFKPYRGGVSYTKISKMATRPGMLLVESHLAFAEPDAWFQGAPILRSKLSIVAQDQIRRLRRELAKVASKSR